MAPSLCRGALSLVRWFLELALAPESFVFVADNLGQRWYTDGINGIATPDSVTSLSAVYGLRRRWRDMADITIRVKGGEKIKPIRVREHFNNPTLAATAAYGVINRLVMPAVAGNDTGAVG